LIKIGSFPCRTNINKTDTYNKSACFCIQLFRKNHCYGGPPKFGKIELFAQIKENSYIETKLVRVIHTKINNEQLIQY